MRSSLITKYWHSTIALSFMNTGLGINGHVGDAHLEVMSKGYTLKITDWARKMVKYRMHIWYFSHFPMTSTWGITFLGFHPILLRLRYVRDVLKSVSFTLAWMPTSTQRQLKDLLLFFCQKLDWSADSNNHEAVIIGNIMISWDYEMYFISILTLFTKKNVSNCHSRMV